MRVLFAAGEHVHAPLGRLGLNPFRPADSFYEIYAEDLEPDLNGCGRTWSCTGGVSRRWPSPRGAPGFPRSGTGSADCSPIEGLAALGTHVVVATGRVAPEDLGPLPAHVTARAWVPQAAAIEHAGLVVHHGGSGRRRRTGQEGILLPGRGPRARRGDRGNAVAGRGRPRAAEAGEVASRRGCGR